MKFCVFLSTLLEVKKKMKRAEKPSFQKRTWGRLKDGLRLTKSKNKTETSSLKKYEDFDNFETLNDRRKSENECFSWIDITFEEVGEINDNEWSSNTSNVGEDTFLGKDFSSSTIATRF